MRVRTFCFGLLWLLTVLLVLFSLVSWASVVVRIPMVSSLVIALGVTLLKRYKRSPVWLLACIIGILVALSSAYPLVTTKGSSATSQLPPVTNAETP